MNRILLALILFLVAALDLPAAGKSHKEALQPFNGLIGSWKATGTPEGTREEKQKGFWTETVSWEWQFKGADAWLNVAFDKGKHFVKGELRYLPDKDAYQLTLQTTAKESVHYEGKLQESRLTLDRVDEATNESQRLVINMLHSNRFLYHYEVKPKDKGLYNKVYLVGATREGVPFASGDGKPECIVSGGLGTMPVTYQGKTYYVCCSGCRSAFNDDPEGFIKDFEAKKAKEREKKKEK